MTMAKEINLHVKYPRSNHPSFSMALWLQRKRNRSPKHIRILLGSYFVSLEILNFLTSQSILNYLLSLSWYEPWIFCFFILLICQFSFELSALAILIFHLSLEKQWPFFFFVLLLSQARAQNATFYDQQCWAHNEIAK